MNLLIRKRLLAGLIDYLVIMIYAVLLLGVTLLAFKVSGTKIDTSTPIKGQLIGFLTLTLPVFLYFYLSEFSNRKGTIGKGLMNLTIESSIEKGYLFRNILKLLPWEIAHFGVHWIVFYSDKQEPTPFWVFVILVLPQLMMVVFFISLIVNKGKETLYDKISKTWVNHTSV